MLSDKLLQQFEVYSKDIVESMYNSLFLKQPKYRNLFSGDNITSQITRVSRFILIWLTKDNLKNIDNELTRIAEKHYQKGVKPEDYVVLAEVLVESIKEHISLSDEELATLVGKYEELSANLIEKEKALLMERKKAV